MADSAYVTRARLAREQGWHPTGTFDSRGRALWASPAAEGLFPLAQLPEVARFEPQLAAA